jgi:hypothetical protein
LLLCCSISLSSQGRFVVHYEPTLASPSPCMFASPSACLLFLSLLI